MVGGFMFYQRGICHTLSAFFSISWNYKKEHKKPRCMNNKTKWSFSILVSYELGSMNCDQNFYGYDFLWDLPPGQILSLMSFLPKRIGTISWVTDWFSGNLKINISALSVLCDTLFLFTERQRVKNNLGGRTGL